MGLLILVLPVLAVYQARYLGQWGVVVGLIYITNLLFAGLTLRSLRLAQKKEKEVEEKRVKYEALLGSIGEGIVVTDQEGKVELINNQAEQMVGWKHNEVIGKKWFEVAPLVNQKGEVIPAENRATQKVLLSGKPIFSDNNFYIRRDGSKFQVGTTAAPVILHGKTVGVIAVFRDVTHEKQVDKAKTEFVSLASHQLRTPLSAIKWYAEMLLNGDSGQISTEQNNFVSNIYQSNERMIELVNSLLNISRIESGRIRIDPEPTDLGVLVGHAVSELQPKTLTKKQKLVISVHHELPKINIDPKLIRQVYLNLLSNAVKYSPDEGEITIMISKKDDQIISQVTDTGCGIPRNDYPRVFDKFYRGENAQKLDTDGNGLGLYLVKAIVESSGGKIWFESRENVGTTFWFSLPLAGTAAKSGEVTIDS